MTGGSPPSDNASAVLAVLKDPGLILGAGVSICLFFSITLIPLLGLFLGSFTPAPILYFYYRKGRLFGLLTALAAGLAVNLIYFSTSQPLGGIVYLEYAVVGLALGECLGRGLTPTRTIGYSALVAVLLAVAVIITGSLAQGKSPLSHGREIVENQIRGSLKVYEALLTGNTGQNSNTEQPTETDSGANKQLAPENQDSYTGEKNQVPGLDLSSQSLERFINVLVSIFPGLMLMGTIVVVWVNMLFGRHLILRTGGGLPPAMENLKIWKAPEILVWVLIACGFSAFIIPGWLGILGLNGLLILGLIYFFQGISIVSFWLDRKSAPPFLKAVIYTFIAIQQYLAVIIAVLGLFDLWFDFRKIKKAG